jgi:hypothetical protein
MNDLATLQKALRAVRMAQSAEERRRAEDAVLSIVEARQTARAQITRETVVLTPLVVSFGESETN